MKIINVLICCVGAQDRPGYRYLLERYQEINVLAETSELFGSSAWLGLAHCDVLLIDEGVIDQYGFQALHLVISGYPRIKVLLIQQKDSQYRALTAVSHGIQGVLTQAASREKLHKAVKSLYGGEAWISRRLLPALHNQLNYKFNNGLPLDQTEAVFDGWERMN